MPASRERDSAWTPMPPDRDLESAAGGFLASETVIELLKKLFSLWENWDAHGDYYLNDLLPLARTRDDGWTPEEHRFISRLRTEASTEEWDSIGAIARSLADHEERYGRFLQTLETFLIRNDFPGARAYASTFGNPNLLRDFERLKRERIREALQWIFQHLDVSNLPQARQEFEALRENLNPEEIEGYQGHVRSPELASLNRQFEAALSEGDFFNAPAILLKIGEVLPESKLNDLQKQLETTRIDAMLRRHQFHGADEAFLSSRYLTRTEYEKIKGCALMTYAPPAAAALF